MVKKKNFKEMGSDELKEQLITIEKNLHAERASGKQTGKPSNPGLIKKLRRDIARIKTFLKQKGVSI
ncbi:MAG: 50S ribosomal protein L29 [Candidatus Micrarchaeota archaeon]